MDEEDDERLLEEFLHLKQRPSRLNAKPIGSVVRRLVAQRGYGQTEAASELERHWAQAVGEELAKASKPGKVARGVLRVHTTTPIAAQEIQFVKSKALRHMQEHLPDMKIRDIRVVHS